MSSSSLVYFLGGFRILLFYIESPGKLVQASAYLCKLLLTNYNNYSFPILKSPLKQWICCINIGLIISNTSSVVLTQLGFQSGETFWF